MRCVFAKKFEIVQYSFFKANYYAQSFLSLHLEIFTCKLPNLTGDFTFDSCLARSSLVSVDVAEKFDCLQFGDY